MFRLLLIAIWTGLVPVYAAETLLDPTRPPTDFESSEDSAEVETAGVPKLTGVKVGRGTRLAILNGTPAKEGEMVAGYEVAAIGERQVTLRHEGSEIELQLLPNIKKEAHKGR